MHKNQRLDRLTELQRLAHDSQMVLIAAQDNDFEVDYFHRRFGIPFLAVESLKAWSEKVLEIVRDFDRWAYATLAELEIPESVYLNRRGSTVVVSASVEVAAKEAAAAVDALSDLARVIGLKISEIKDRQALASFAALAAASKAEPTTSVSPSSTVRSFR